MGKNLLVGVIEHGFKEATDRSLIFVGDASVPVSYTHLTLPTSDLV